MSCGKKRKLNKIKENMESNKHIVRRRVLSLPYEQLQGSPTKMRRARLSLETITSSNSNSIKIKEKLVFPKEMIRAVDAKIAYSNMEPAIKTPEDHYDENSSTILNQGK